MSEQIKNIAPKPIWEHFYDLTQIPRPSGHEAKAIEYLVEFAKKHNIEYVVDKASNFIMRKPATPGYEDRKGCILQGHIDMVPQKNNDKVFDFEKDPIDAYIDGDWVTADGTTLGSDNGIGVATILAVFADNTLEHGPIEALVTVTEETGMFGAFGLEAGILKGEILLNLDSEDAEELCVGCAGGIDVNAVINYRNVAAPKGYAAFFVNVSGLKGGHSGIQINCQRANSNKVFFRLLRELPMPWELANVNGGGLRNAIPRECVGTVLVPEAKKAAFKKYVAKYEKVLQAEYVGIEDSISVKAEEVAAPKSIIPTETSHKLACAVLACPNGVDKMSVDIPGLVETSNNFARVVSNGRRIQMNGLTRGMVLSEKRALALAIKSALELGGAKVILSGDYDGWKPNTDSAILKEMVVLYKKMFKKEPNVKAIHAGLECGIISGKYPGLDMISFGPTIMYPHSPDEKVNIKTVADFYEYLLAILKNAPKK